MAQANQMVKEEEISPVVYVPENRPLTRDEITAQAGKVQEVLRSVMIKEVHYGKVPGTGKNTLLKPGAEKLLSTFRIACEPIVTDLSTDDCIKYRVEARGTSMQSGSYLGSGIGECSTDEDKYRWRKVVCDEEFDGTPEDRRRIKFAKSEGKVYKTKQIRTNPADLANTVLKMAKKRAQVDLCLTVTAASDVFSQDIEDLPEDIRESVAGDERPAPTVQQPQRKAQPAAPTGDTISEPQAKRLWAIRKNAGVSDEAMADFLLREYDLEDDRSILKRDYDKIVAWAQRGGKAA